MDMKMGKQRRWRPWAWGLGAILLLFGAWIGLSLAATGQFKVGKYSLRSSFRPYEQSSLGNASLAVQPIPAGKNIWDDGDPQAAEEKMRSLIQQIQELEGDFMAISWREFRLDDGILSPNVMDRMGAATHISPSAFLNPQPTSTGRAKSELYQGILLTCRLYAAIETLPNGVRSYDRSFYLIGYADGRVERIPLSQVRHHFIPGTQGQFVPVFPGMAAYAKARPIPNPRLAAPAKSNTSSPGA
jgi:hypothetical protein